MLNTFVNCNYLLIRSLIVCFYFCMPSAYGQKLLVTYVSEEDEITINNGHLFSLGNHSPSESIVVKQIIIKNVGDKNLHIQEMKLDNPESHISGYFAPSYDIPSGNSQTINLYYYDLNKGFDTDRNNLLFQSNDVNNKQIKIPLIVNPDKGELLLSCNQSLKGQTISLGNVKIGTSKHIVLTMENIGLGFMRVGKVNNVVTNNRLNYSYSKGAIWGNKTAYNNIMSLEAITPGVINTSFSHDLYRGTRSNLDIKIVGKVVAPIMQVEYDSHVLNSKDDIRLPDNYMKEYIAEFKVKNTGDDEMLFTDVRLSDQINSGFFFMSPHGLLDILPGESKVLRLRIIPTRVGVIKDKIHFYSDGYMSNDLEIDISIDVKDPSTSVVSKPLENVTIYPNPCRDILNIKGMNGRDCKVKIYDEKGVLCLSKDIDHAIGRIEKLRLPDHISSSFFIVELENNQGLKRVKVLRK